MDYPNNDVSCKIIILKVRGQQHVGSLILHGDLLLVFKYISLVPISKWMTCLQNLK
jgi:hypothetical protein